MKIERLEELARAGKLQLEQFQIGVQYREKGWRGVPFNDQTNKNWSKETYCVRKFCYKARTNEMLENEGFKITKKDFIFLNSIYGKQNSER